MADEIKDFDSLIKNRAQEGDSSQNDGNPVDGDNDSQNQPADSDDSQNQPADSDNGEGEGDDSQSQPGEGDDVEGEGDDDQSQQSDSDSGEGEGDDDQNQSNIGQDSEPEIDLDDYYINVDGQEKSVNEVIEERNQLASELNEIKNDEFLQRFIDYYKATGDVSAFLQSQAVDYDKVSDVDVLRKQFDKDNADLSQEDRDILFQDEIARKYLVDPEGEVDTESKAYKTAQALLKRDANRARVSLKEEQKKFALPEKKETTQFDPKKYAESLKQEKNLADFVSKKLLKINASTEDGQAFGYEVENPDVVIEMMTNDSKFWNLFVDPKDGKVDRVRQAKVYAYAQDPERFEEQLIEFGKTLAKEKNLKEKRNTDGTMSPKSSVTPDGVNDFKSGFLKALKQQKVKR